MSLADCIRTEIEAGRLHRYWELGDLRNNVNLAARYSRNTLNSVPVNWSISLCGLELGTGDSVKEKTESALFYRVGRERSLIFALLEHAGEPDPRQSAAGSRKRGNLEVQADSNELRRLFNFMNQADKRLWNERLQAFWNKKALSHCENEVARLTALFRVVVATQSSIKLDNIALFWEKLSKYQWPSRCPSVKDLVNFLLAGVSAKVQKKIAKNSTGKPWEQLFYALRAQNGWGDKTAALFIKNVILVHRSSAVGLHFLSDGVALAGKLDADSIFLPVDAVIIHIFETFFSGLTSSNFTGINRFLQVYYTPEEILRWDDLWFWGFLTQNSKPGETDMAKKSRAIGWNTGKYWALEYYTDVDLDSIKNHAEEFIEITKQIDKGQP